MSRTRPEWSEETARRGDGLIALRRDFHRHPELERPGCYFRLAPGPARPHHAPVFEMNEAGLPVGLRVGLAVMRSALGR